MHRIVDLRPTQPLSAQSADWTVLSERIRRIEQRGHERLERAVAARAAVRAAEAEIDNDARKHLQQSGINVESLDPLRRLLHDRRAQLAEQLGTGPIESEAETPLPPYAAIRARRSIIDAQALYPQYANTIFLEDAGYDPPGWATGPNVNVRPADPNVQWVGFIGDGSGDGWFADPNPTIGTVYWVFLYIPPESHTYQIAPYFMFRGHYAVMANADWLTPNKIAEVGISTYGDVWQSYDPGGETGCLFTPGVVGYGGPNTCESGRFDGDFNDAASVFLEGQRLTFITAYADVLITVIGDGSHGEIIFGGDDADFIACPFMHVSLPPSF